GEPLSRAVDDQIAVIGGVDSGDDLDQGRFAGAVVADEADDFAAADGEMDIGQCLDGPEPFVDAAQFEHGFAAASRRPRNSRRRFGCLRCHLFLLVTIVGSSVGDRRAADDEVGHFTPASSQSSFTLPVQMSSALIWSPTMSLTVSFVTTSASTKSVGVSL